MFQNKATIDLAENSEKIQRYNEIIPLLQEMKQYVEEIEQLQAKVSFPQAKDFFEDVYIKYHLNIIKDLSENYGQKEVLNKLVGDKELYDTVFSKLQKHKQFLDENKNDLKIIFSKLINISNCLNTHPLTINNAAQKTAIEFLLEHKKLIKEKVIMATLKKLFSNENGKIELTKENDEKFEEMISKKKEEVILNGIFDEKTQNEVVDFVKESFIEFIGLQKKLSLESNVNSIKQSLSELENTLSRLKINHVLEDVHVAIEQAKKTNNQNIQNILENFQGIGQNLYDLAGKEENLDEQTKKIESASEIMIKVFQIFNA